MGPLFRFVCRIAGVLVTSCRLFFGYMSLVNVWKGALIGGHHYWIIPLLGYSDHQIDHLVAARHSTPPLQDQLGMEHQPTLASRPDGVLSEGNLPLCRMIALLARSLYLLLFACEDVSLQRSIPDNIYQSLSLAYRSA